MLRDFPRLRVAVSVTVALAAAHSAAKSASAEIYGVKAHNAAEGGPLPVVLYGFQEDGSASRYIGDPFMNGEPIVVDGLAFSPEHGLLGFQLSARGSQLITLSTTSAEARPRGPLLSGREVRGATFDGGDLLALDAVTSELLRIDPATGAVQSAVTIDVVVDVESDIAADGRGRLILASLNRANIATHFYSLDRTSGRSLLLYVERDILPGERYPIDIGGLAFSESTGPDVMFAFDVDDRDDVLRYEFPLRASARNVLYRAVHPTFNAGHVDLAGYIAPQAPTATPSPTSSPRATSTSSPSSTSTSTATATATSLPEPTQPPACVPVDQPVDIALVVDRSSSMQDRGKIDGAKTALAAFIDAAAAPPDRLALITFADIAAVSQPLTTDKSVLHAAVQRIVLGSGTRIDLGLQRGREELLAASDSTRARAMILLTDGRQTGQGADTVRAEAALAKDAGMLLFVIGLGQDVDADLLRGIATSPNHYHFAPTPTELEAIYRLLSAAIPCPTPTAQPPTTPDHPATPTPTHGTPSVATPTVVPTGTALQTSAPPLGWLYLPAVQSPGRRVSVLGR